MLITYPEALKKYSAEHRVWQGIPGIARTRSGRTYISFYSGNVKETYGNFAALIRSDDGINYSEPVAVAVKAGKYRCFDPVLWIDPLERLWFIWNVMPGEAVYAAICDDPDADELSWNEPFCIGRGVMMNKPVVLTSGEWLFPISFWKFDIYRDMRKCGYLEDDESKAFVYKTSDNGKTFVKLGGADVRDRSFDEHMVVELRNSVLMMLVRTNYGIGVSYSYDRGKNWSSGTDSGYGGPCSRFFFWRLASGRLLMINHHGFKGRNNLTAMLSEDDGKTFPYKLLIDERNEVSYPDAVQDDSGNIYIVYDRQRGCFKHSLDEAYGCAREIITAKITEQDIINGSLVTADSRLKNVVSKLGKLAKEDYDPYTEMPMDDGVLAEFLIAKGGPDIIEKVFEKYPINCMNAANFDGKRLDSMIGRFENTGRNDVKTLSEIIAYIRCTPDKKIETYPVVDMAKDFLEEKLNEPFSVSDLAERMHISVYYLTHLFKSVTGITMIEYRNELRLTQAKLMLVNSDESIGDIAQKTGFCSAAYFTEVFSKSEKIPPSEYRKYHGR